MAVMVRLEIVYLKQPFLLKMKIQIFIDGKPTIVLRPGETGSLELAAGERTMLAKCSFRKKKVILNLKEDRTISMRWDRFYGTINIVENWSSEENCPIV